MIEDKTTKEDRVHGDIRHLENSGCAELARHQVHGDIRHLESDIRVKR